MKTNDTAVWISIAMVLGTSVIVGALAHYGISQTAADWTQSILTGGAVIVALVMPVWERRNRRAYEERIAAVKIAARLRAWMRLTADAVIQHQQYEDTSGADGDASSGVPDLNIHVDLVAGVSVEYAKTIYSILEQLERDRQQTATVAAYVDDDAAQGTFYAQVAILFARVRRLYRKLARETGLHELTSQRWELDAINRAAEAGDLRDWVNL